MARYKYTPELLATTAAESHSIAEVLRRLGIRWNGGAHVDHHNGDFLDNRPDNLRLLCPNCHSQTATYAGRSRRSGDIAVAADAATTALLRFHDGELTAAQAATQIGCDPSAVPVMRMHALGGRSTGSIRAAHRAAQRDAVIAYALAHPGEGYRAIAAGLRAAPDGSVIVGHGRIRRYLVTAGLNTPAARREAAERDTGGPAKADG